MAIWKKLLSNTRLRSLFILLGVFLSVVVIVVFYQYTRTTLGASGSASVANLSPTGTSSEVPQTQKMSPEYLNALLQSQKQQRKPLYRKDGRLLAILLLLERWPSIKQRRRKQCKPAILVNNEKRPIV